jgi:ribosomal protein S18 acetylase RimI-like enzyme
MGAAENGAGSGTGSGTGTGTDGAFEIRWLGSGDDQLVLDAAVLFDATPRRDWTAQFLGRDGHHLLIAYLGDTPVGFISGVETLHPDKGAEMFVYELGVDDPYRRRGVASELVRELLEVARRRGCYGMWVPVEPDNEAALATYRSTGAAGPDPAANFTWSIAPGA